MESDGPWDGWLGKLFLATEISVIRLSPRLLKVLDIVMNFHGTNDTLSPKNPFRSWILLNANLHVQCLIMVFSILGYWSAEAVSNAY